MGKKTPKVKRTTSAQVRSCLRERWMKSPERAAALKRDGYTCQICDKKQTMRKGEEFKVAVHHVEEINWDNVLAKLMDDRRGLFCHPDNLLTVCIECHKKIHETGEL